MSTLHFDLRAYLLEKHSVAGEEEEEEMCLMQKIHSDCTAMQLPGASVVLRNKVLVQLTMKFIQNLSVLLRD